MVEAGKDLNQVQCRMQKFEIFKGGAVRTDRNMRFSTSNVRISGPFWRRKVEKGLTSGIKLGWPAKQKQILPQVQDKRIKTQNYNSKYDC